MKKLYLASQSASRQQLLTQMGIPFTLLAQSADETVCDWSQALEVVVSSIAEHKMAHLKMPLGEQGEVLFVITADTLTQDMKGVVYGKPVDLADAARHLQALRPESVVATAVCVHKKQYTGEQWQTIAARTQTVTARCEFDIPDHWIERYIAQVPVLQCAGSMAIEQYGMQFVKAIYGSYSGIQGLPAYELRQILQEFGFFDER